MNKVQMYFKARECISTGGQLVSADLDFFVSMYSIYHVYEEYKRR